MKLLVHHRDEAWVHQLGALGAAIDVVVGPGGRVAAWRAQRRPLPEGARTVTLDEAVGEGTRYDCVITHDISELLSARVLGAPRLLVLHDTLEERMAREGTAFEVRQVRALLNTHLASVAGHAIAVSRRKARSWGVTHTVVHNSADPSAYPGHVGDVASGIRVADHVRERRQALAWDFHCAALEGLPVRVVGDNTDVPGARPPNDWEHLKRMLSSHRFYVHTADPQDEDGYDMAVLEAMAAGLPVLANEHPGCIVEHGVTGFVAATPGALRQHAERLLADEALALRLGENARAWVARYFGPDRFRADFTRAIQEARKKWSRREVQASNRIIG